MNRRLFIAVLLCLLVAALAVSVSAEPVASGSCGDNLTWTLDNAGTLTISGTGAMWDFRNDAEFYDYHQCLWAELKDQIKQVVFTPGVTYVGADAFFDCTNLTQVTFCDTITSIGNFVFYNCYELQNVTLPANLQSLGQEAFAFCHSLTAVTIPKSLNFLDANVFEGCENLSYVYFEGDPDLPGYIIGNSPFRFCNGLKEILVSKDHFCLDAPEGVLYSGTTLIQYPLGKESESYTVRTGTLRIEQFAFENAELIKQVTIPESVTSIGTYAFSNCVGLDKVFFTGNAPEIEPYTFELTTVTAYYPAGNPTWTEDVMQQYRGNVTWVPYGVYNGLTMVDGIWGYYEDGVLKTDYTGLVQYMGNWYYVANGILDWGYTGLTLYNDVWWYVQNGQLVWGYNGLVCHNGVWYYVENSAITWTYTGLVEYMGNWYYVENSSINWGYTGLYQHNYTWYVIQGGQLIWGYDGLVLYNDLWFYAENSTITFTFTGLAEYEGILFYFEGNCLNWSYNGKAEYNGVEYDVVNGMAFF